MENILDNLSDNLQSEESSYLPLTSYEDIDVMHSEMNDELIIAYEEYSEADMMITSHLLNSQSMEGFFLDELGDVLNTNKAINVITKMIASVIMAVHKLGNALSMFISSLFKRIRMRKSSTYSILYALSKSYSKDIMNNGDIEVSTAFPVKHPSEAFDKINDFIESIQKLIDILTKELESDKDIKSKFFNLSPSDMKTVITSIHSVKGLAMDSFINAELPNSKVFINELIYNINHDHFERVPMRANDFFKNKVINYDELSGKNFSKMVEMEKISRTGLKVIKKNLKVINKLTEVAKSTNKLNPETKKTILGSVMWILRWNSLITNFLTAGIMESFNEYLYLRHIVYAYGFKYIESQHLLGDEKCTEILNKLKKAEKFK